MAHWTVVLSGGIGSGKSLVSAMFAKRQITIVEQDDLSREVVAPGQPALSEIADYFGVDILDSEGSLKRGELRKRIFSNPDDRLWLNRLLHPLINQLTTKRIKSATSMYAIVVNPLLRHRSSLYDRHLIVDAPVETQVQRTMLRDNISHSLAMKMIRSQTDRNDRLKLADDVIVNDNSKVKVDKRVESLHRRYLLMAR